MLEDAGVLATVGNGGDAYAQTLADQHDLWQPVVVADARQRAARGETGGRALNIGRARPLDVQRMKVYLRKMLS